MPFHRDFEEVNLRFYVRRETAGGLAAGRRLSCARSCRGGHRWLARLLYNEPYLACPMRHRVDAGSCEYAWRFGGRWHSMARRSSGEPAPLATGSAEEFIFEHYWGYTRQRDGGTAEYQVEHPRWRVWTAHNAAARLRCGGTLRCGIRQEPLGAAPRSAFVAEGSPVRCEGGCGC